MAATTNNSLPQLRLNSGEDFGFADEWKSAFGTVGLSDGESKIDKAETAIEGAVSSVQEHYTHVNAFYDAHVDTIKSVVDITSAHIDMKGLESVFHSFQEAAGVLVKGLDELGKLHPFIAVAVIPFKLIYALDSSRRDNNKKVLAIKVQMKDMMLALFQLRHVRDSEETGPDGTSIAGRLQSLMQAIAQEIKECGNACDAYLKKSFLAKTFKSKFYEPKLASYGDIFVKRKGEIEYALTVHTAVGVDNANVKLDSVNEHMRSMEDKIDTLLLFRKLDTPRELDLQRFIESRGGIRACIKSDTHLPDLLKKDDSTHQHEKTVERSRNRLLEELLEDEEEALKKNFEVFGRKLEVQSRQLDALNDTIHDQGDHIISVIMAGSHDYILDKDLQRIWKMGGWKGSVKARHFVLTLHDYYSEYQDQVAESNAESPTSAYGSSGVRDLPVVPPLHAMTHLGFTATQRKHHRWALSYVNIAHLQSIMEAIDDDGTGFVTIKEVNTFAASRPSGWSLLHWLAYWSSGWHISLTRYHDKIQALLSQLFTAYKHVLPPNKPVVTAFLDAMSITHVGQILYATRLRQGAKIRSNAEEALAALVEEYSNLEENRMRETLETIAYNIDTQSTVVLVTGPGRIERHLFPLLYLLLQRYLKVVILGSIKIFDPDELSTASTSLESVLSSVNDRTASLIAIFSQTSADVKSRFANFSYGMFSSTYGGTISRARNDYLDRSRSEGDLEALEHSEGSETILEDSLEAHVKEALILDAHILKQSKQPNSEAKAKNQLVEVFYTAPTPVVGCFGDTSLEIERANLGSSCANSVGNENIIHAGIQGVWTTYFLDDIASYIQPQFGLIQISIKFVDPSSTNYSVTGVAQTMYVVYEVNGRFFPTSRRLGITLTSEDAIPIVIQAKANVENDTINGSWTMLAPWDDIDVIHEYLNDEDKLKTAEDFTHWGHLTLVRTPAHLSQFRITPVRGVLSLARCRWVFALGAALHLAQKKLWSWSYLKSYCVLRRKQILYWTRSKAFTVRLTASMQDPRPFWDYRRLRSDLSPADAQFYLHSYLGVDLPDPYVAQDGLLGSREKGAAGCPLWLRHWCGLWCGHLFHYQTTEELSGWQGLIHFALSEFDGEGEAREGGVLVKGVGQSHYGSISVSGFYRESDESMALSLRFSNLSSLEAIMKYDEKTDTLTGNWEVLPRNGDVSSIEGDPKVGGFTAPLAKVLFTRTDASVFRYKPALDPILYPVALSQERNAAKLRWNFAIKAVIHQVRQRLWSWNYFRGRAAERSRFLEQLKKERMASLSPFNATARDRACDSLTDNIMWTNTPVAYHVYGEKVMMEFRTLQVHEYRFGCDWCNASLLTTRLICLTCISDSPPDGIDLCETCIDKSPTRDAFQHNPSHPLLKCPDYLYDHQFHSVISQGREIWERMRKRIQESGRDRDAQGTLLLGGASNSVSEATTRVPVDRSINLVNLAAEHSNLSCTFCRVLIKMTVWACIECQPDIVCVCSSCAFRHPKVLKETDSSTHLARHILVRVQGSDSDGWKAASREETQDSRLEKIERKLVEFQHGLNDLNSGIQGNVQPRLEKLEGSIGRIEKMLFKLAKRFELEDSE